MPSKKMSKQTAYNNLKRMGISPTKRDFFSLTSREREIVHSYGKLTGYKKSKNAPGSYGRMFFQHLERLAGSKGKNRITP